MTGPAQLSYSHGASPHSLLGETIGDNLRRVAAAYPGAGGPTPSSTPTPTRSPGA